MIRVTIELWPFGDRSKAKSLGVIDIWNTGSGDAKTGNYQYCAWPAGTSKDIPHLQSHIDKARWSGDIYRFPRQRLLVFDLLYRVLRNTFSNRNGDGYDFSNGIRGKYVERLRSGKLKIVNGMKDNGRRVRKPTSSHRRKHSR